MQQCHSKHQPKSVLYNFFFPNQPVLQRGKSADNQSPPPKQSENRQQRINLSPDKLNPVIKPFIDLKSINAVKRRKNSQPLIKHNNDKGKCINHSQKQGTYRAFIENQILYYCTKCSMQLASQGFAVEKIMSNEDRYHSRRRTLSGNMPSVLQYTPRFRQIEQFLNQITRLKEQINLNVCKFQNLPRHYQIQTQMVEQFYNQLLAYVQKLKQQNINYLQTQSRKYEKISQSQFNIAGKHLFELQSISSDISLNIKEILEKISEQKFRNCISFYRQRLQKYEQNLQNQQSELKQVTNYVKDDCDLTYLEIVEAVNRILGIDDYVENEKDKVEGQYLFENFDSFGVKKIMPKKSKQKSFRKLFSSEEKGRQSFQY